MRENKKCERYRLRQHIFRNSLFVSNNSSRLHQATNNGHFYLIAEIYRIILLQNWKPILLSMETLVN